MNKKLILVIILALIIRLILLSTHEIIEIDGSNYIRVAENLASGNGYKDLSDKTNVVFPPLYPLVTAGAGYFINNFELAGRIVSLIFGLGLIIVMYFIGKKFYDQRTGIICCSLTALYPALTFISGITYSESLYLFLVSLGLFMGWKSLESRRKYWRYFISGIIFGLAYLTRSEGLLFALVLIFLILIFKNSWKFKIRNISFLLLGIILISLPYWIFLYSQLGVVTLGVQSTPAFLEKSYILTHETDIAKYELNYLAHDFSAESFKGAESIFSYILRNPSKFFRRYFNNLYKEQTSTIPKLYPIIFILVAFAGVILGDWDSIRKKKELYLILFFLAPLLALPISYVSPRMILSSLLVLLIWTGNGIKELDKGIREKFRLKHLILIFVLIAFLFGNFLIGKIDISDTAFTWDSRESNLYKEAGLWIKENYSDTSIMTRECRISYYAGARNVKLAYGDIQHIIKESCKKDVDLIVFDKRNIGRLRPELVYLFDKNEAPLNLVFIKNFENNIVIYRPICI